MVVQPNERNVSDQQGLVEGLAKKGVKMIQKTLLELSKAVILNEQLWLYFIFNLKRRKKNQCCLLSIRL